LIRVERVSKRFGRTRALREVEFRVGRGEVVGFVGPNGAGKTTTLRIITGFLDPDEGRVLVAGCDVRRERDAARRHLGYLPESVPLYGDMRVDEYLRFRARLKAVPRGEVAARVDAAVERVDLGAVRRRIVGELSKGFRQRVGLADALVARPPILVLDEPTAGLDPVQVRELRQLLGALGGEHTVLLSSHALAEVEAVADRVVMLAAGRVVAEGTAGALRERLGLAPDASFEEVFVALADAGREPSPRPGGEGQGGGRPEPGPGERS
jgi:ABC-2 type transport system ATP-binding protein